MGRPYREPDEDARQRQRLNDADLRSVAPLRYVQAYLGSTVELSGKSISDASIFTSEKVLWHSSCASAADDGKQRTVAQTKTIHP